MKEGEEERRTGDGRGRRGGGRRMPKGKEGGRGKKEDGEEKDRREEAKPLVISVLSSLTPGHMTLDPVAQI